MTCEKKYKLRTGVGERKIRGNVGAETGEGKKKSEESKQRMQETEEQGMKEDEMKV